MVPCDAHNRVRAQGFGMPKPKVVTKGPLWQPEFEIIQTHLEKELQVLTSADSLKQWPFTRAYSHSAISEHRCAISSDHPVQQRILIGTVGAYFAKPRRSLSVRALVLSHEKMSGARALASRRAGTSATMGKKKMSEAKAAAFAKAARARHAAAPPDAVVDQSTLAE